MWLDADPANVTVNVTVIGSDEWQTMWAEADRNEAEARLAQSRAAAKRRNEVSTMRRSCWTAPDACRVLEVNKQRVYQLSKP